MQENVQGTIRIEVQRITVTVHTALPSGTVFGVQGTIGLSSLGCNCNLGVVGGVFAPNPLSIDVPSTPSLVGSVFSVQGYGYSGANCLGLFDLTDTIDFEIR